MVTGRSAWLLLLLAAGCGEEWSPESIIEDLRVIGMKAEPAELKPGESAALSALIIDPTRVGQKVTVIWLGCDPDPFNLGRSACSDLTALQDPAALVSGGELPRGVKLIGLGDAAAYATDPGVFSALKSDDPRRKTGTVGQVLAIAVAEETSGAPTMTELAALFERVKNKEVKSVITLFRVKISEAPSRNTNPKITGLKVGGERQLPGVRTQVFQGQKVEVELEADDASFETFGPLPTDVEKLISAWYSTSGRFNSLRLTLRTMPKVDGIFTAPGNAEFPRDPVPERRTGTFHVVLRDTRGGQDWIEHPFYVSDIAAPDPVVTAVRSPAARGELVVIEGRNLEGLLDVVVGNLTALTTGSLNQSTGHYEALIPPSVPAGTYSIALHGKSGRRLPVPPFSLTVP